MIEPNLTRRQAIGRITAAAAGTIVPASLLGCRDTPEGGEATPDPAPAAELPAAASDDELSLINWVETLRSEGLASSAVPFGLSVARVGELAIGTPYEGFTLEEYIRAGGSPVRTEPLTLSLSRFDCVSLVETCMAVARMARKDEPPSWEGYEYQMERMRYRGGVRDAYASRLHYFSEWLEDNQRRGLVRILGEELGGVPDERLLRFMSSNPESYPALEYPDALEAIEAMERSLDGHTRWVIPTARIPAITDQIETGDILAFGTSIEGLDVTHAALAYRDDQDVMRVLHAPLSGGVVEITRTTIPEYVAAIRRSTGILVARPLPG